MVDFPTTLIIGLGGVGSEITADIYSKFIATHPSDIEKRNIFCLCFDTDAGDIKKRKEILPKNCVVKTSSDLSSTVGDYLDSIRANTDALNWFDTSSKEVINMKLNKGAGQIRMASRLAYMAAMGEEKLKAIDYAVSSLLTLEPERHAGNEISVHIICSLAGGTGAGSFLQTAYYVKDIMRNDYHINSPEITGYFVLADVLVNDREVGFNNNQIENARSNTYACLKELDAFIHKDKIQVLKPIDFEYKIGQQDLHLPHAVPYNLCYLVDFTTRQGENLNNKEQYYSQVIEYVYLSVFTDIGTSTRSRLINDIRQTVEKDGDGAYSAIGVSKMVYPVDDILAYFANAKVVENLSESWLVLDDIYKKARIDYDKKLHEGIKADEPKIEDIFCDNVEKIAKNGTGLQKTIFKNIYDSTGVLDEEMVRVNDKARVYVEAVEEHAKEVIDSNRKFDDLYNKCKTEMDSFMTEDDETNDVDSIREREEYLEKFKKYAKAFVEQVKTGTIEDCFLASHDEPARVSPDSAKSQHQLNTFILQKNHEMHPLAARYFLYDVKKRIEERISVLKPETDDLLKQIDDMYRNNFNVIDDKNDADDEYKESAQDKMSIIYSHNKAFYKRFWHKLTGKSPIKECKEEYLKFSGIQNENIKAYAETQLTLMVFEGLLVQIGRLIEESERFFERLPRTLQSLRQESEALLTMHDDNMEPSILYVLAESKFKKIIYEDEVRMQGTVFFPADLSGEIYRTMYDTTWTALTRNKRTVELTEKEKEEIWNAQLAADMEVFKAVLKAEEDTLRKECPYAKMTVISALREEADRAVPNGLPGRDAKVFEYMKERFSHLKEMAAPRGADNVNTNENRPINSWGFHPDCVKKDGRGAEGALTAREAAELFGGSDIDTSPLIAASREESKLFSRYEIIRADSINQLELAKNFKAFVDTPTNELTQGNTGAYYKAYMDVINRIINGSKAYSPHLDKRWHLPSYLPNIGMSMDDSLKEIYAALCYGLLFGRLTVKDDYWYCISEVSDFVADLDKHPIAVKGKSVAMAVNNLYELGLANNPKIVSKILKYVEKQWTAAKERWQNTDDPTLDKMKNQPIIKKIKDFSFAKVYPAATSWANAKYNFFFFANAGSQAQNRMIAKNMLVFKPFIIHDLITKIIDVFGPSDNTYALCKYVFNTACDDQMLKEEALAILEAEGEAGRFIPKTKD